MTHPNKRTPRRARPLPPLMAQAFANLGQALDFKVPANLGDKFPFFIKGVDDRPGRQIGEGSNPSGLPAGRVRTALERVNSTGAHTSDANWLSPAPIARIENVDELVAALTAMATKDPRGATGVAELLGVNAGSMRPLLTGGYKGRPRKIMAAYNAWLERRAGLCRACGQPLPSIYSGAPAEPPTLPSAPAGLAANLDRTGKRYVLADCMVELPDLAMARVGRVENGRWWLPTALEPHQATCNEVRVLMRTHMANGTVQWQPA